MVINCCCKRSQTYRQRDTTNRAQSESFFVEIIQLDEWVQTNGIIDVENNWILFTRDAHVSESYGGAREKKRGEYYGLTILKCVLMNPENPRPQTIATLVYEVY